MNLVTVKKTMSYLSASSQQKLPFQKVSLLAMTLIALGSLGAASPAMAKAQQQSEETQQVNSLTSLTNLQNNNDFMVSSGLPAKAHLALLKEEGVAYVVDLIPGDRSQEIMNTAELGLNYFNVPVEWEKPVLTDFLNYSAFMQRVDRGSEKVLTHCKLNWRGASFTYLYRVNVLGEDENMAKKDLLAIWQPNPTWYAFMKSVIAHYNAINSTDNAMSFDAAIPKTES
ncbi:hypothetical protein [Alteromonas genovensis]|uniref:hypothetical protein n=1 Tax=Alteromonas genovensis TaxID=471225 RepID=UPI002FDFF88C